MPNHSEMTAISEQDSERSKSRSPSPSVSWYHLGTNKNVQKGSETQEATEVSMLSHSQFDSALHIATEDSFFTS